MHSNYIQEMINATINNEVSEEDAILLIKEYYENNNLKEHYNHDLIYYQIAMFINKDYNFKLDPKYLRIIHSNIFHNIMGNAGQYREKNISRSEDCLHFRSVIYAQYDMIPMDLEYDFDLEKKKSYKKKSLDEKVIMLSKFISNIWQAHPFSDGNTRTDMVFLRKYLEYMDIYHNPDIFNNNFTYFRNSLVRSNYNTIGWIEPTYEYLNKFIYNLLLGNTDKLDILETYVPEDAMVLKRR